MTADPTLSTGPTASCAQDSSLKTQASPTSRTELAAILQQKIRRWERSQRNSSETVSSGAAGLDRLLVEGGFTRPALIEWLSAGRGAGAATLALAVAVATCRQAGALVVIDRPKRFYPPAMAGWGCDWQSCVIVRPRNDRDEAWALDQTLRSPAVGAVLAWPQQLSQRRYRQLQLAAEAGAALGLIVRDRSARHEPSWAELRLLVTPAPAEQGVTRHLARDEGRGAAGRGRAGTVPFCDALGAKGDCPLRRDRGSLGRRRLRVEILHARSGRGAGAVELELDEQTGGLYEYEPSPVVMAPSVAAPTTGRRSTGA